MLNLSTSLGGASVWYFPQVSLKGQMHASTEPPSLLGTSESSVVVPGGLSSSEWAVSTWAKPVGTLSTWSCLSGLCIACKKKCWCLGTFKFGFGPPCLVYKPKKQNKKGQVKMVLCLLPFLFSFLLFGERFAGFWAPTLLAYFNFALSHFSLHLNLSLLFSSHSHLHGTSLQILE